MPLYTYICTKHGTFEFHSSIADYQPKRKCTKCSKKCERSLVDDAESVIGVGDATPKTLGGLADKQADKLSADQKAEMKKNHNAYREADPNVEPKPLPAGMSRIERPKEREYWT